MKNGIIHVRVDDRMLHGIVATDWIPKSGATRAMVVDEAASKNDIVRSSLKMACPAGVALSVLDPQKAAANILSGKYNSQKVFVICRYIKWAYTLFQAGVSLEQINLGNVTQNKENVTALDKTVRVSPEEKEMLKEMRDAGVKITVRFRPDNPEVGVGDQLG
ncbi:PTS sugar transporter subunit IIB [Clostridium sp. KNHs216]|uniref:PTS sugar transporter subunit IIB n=1 Tax=Clostridium sp. KNHs216 TaxID=1550235 RepID=UPI00114D9DE7|nr:PTS sugar transporter subunit IIB [Clostridium sp. KNHs216]TQI68350.1 PTS system mannose-specific IIB component [Clostridium sp. KNHs216]